MASNFHHQGPAHKNHYVPVWYQAGFQVDSVDNWLLDIQMPKLRPDGTPIVLRPRQRPARSSFWLDELYVTRFGEVINDQVETVLFQEIDNFGSDAVRAFVAGDERAMHHQLNPLLSYMGAQRLRTPKGLAWIQSRYPALSQVELLTELQHLRNMFGTLWAECVREIVSAEHSQVKFLISDHPVAFFNSALPADALQYVDPMDPPLTWNRTQTLFPLDANHLLILTHVPYAKEPERVEAASKRVNARYFGHAMMRTDVLVRSRSFTTEQVTSVNRWLKARARRYVAAANVDWLYPEASGLNDIAALAQLFRPPNDELWRYGGETYIGYEDGTSAYRDQYGRTSREYEIVAKIPPSEPPKANDACPCGSGTNFATCCESRPVWERAPWNVLSLRERNLRFITAIANVLGLSRGVEWPQIQRDLSDEQVSMIHRLSQGLWPSDTDLTALLPKHDADKVRAVYMGMSDPRTLGENIAALTPFFDQILVMDPFVFGRNVRAEFSPLANPAQHKLQLLKNVVFWMTLAPLIDAGKVLIFPDPGEIKLEMQRVVLDVARARTAEWTMTEAEFDEMRWLGREDAERAMRQFPDEYWLQQIKEHDPEATDDDAANVLAYMRRQWEADPLALLQIAAPGQSGQFFIMRGVNLEIGLFIAQIVGAVIVTDVSAMWRQLHLHTRARSIEITDDPPSPFRFTANLHPGAAVEIAQSIEAGEVKGSVQKMRAALDHSSRFDEFRRLSDVIQTRLDALSVSVRNSASDAPLVTMSLTPSTPESGFESPVVQRLIVSFGSDDAPPSVGLAFFRRTEGRS